jgi:hypothetical protein
MKRCGRCQQDKPLDQFAWRNKAKGQRQSCCRSCQQDYSAQWYRANAAKQLASVAANNLRYRAEAQAVIMAAKDVPCTDCGIRYPHYVMDFDHVRGTKVMHVGLMASRHRTLGKLREEIAKCEVVCSNCHRARTYLRRLESASVA